MKADRILFFLAVFSVHAVESVELSLADLFDLHQKVESVSLFEEEIIDAPSTAYRFDFNQLQNRIHRKTFRDALEYLPGVFPLQGYSQGDTLSIRGYASTFSSQGISTLFDGVPLNTISFGNALAGKSNIGPALLDHLELIAGPGSTIYGTDAFHGVLSLRSWNPSYDGNSYSISLGNDSYIETSYRLSEYVDDHRLSVALSNSHLGDQSIIYETPYPSQNLIPRKNSFDSMSAVFKIQSENDRRVSYEVTHLFSNWDGDQGAGFGAIYRAPNIAELKTLFRLTSAKFHWNKSGSKTLSLQGYHWKHDHEFQQSTQGGWAAANGTNVGRDIEQRIGFNLLWRVRNPSNDNHWLLGVSMDLQKELDGYQGFPSIGYTPRSFKGLKRRVNSIYAQSKNYLYENRLSLVSGVRLDYYDSFGSQISPRAGLIYKPEKNSAIKLLYGSAFRSPSGAEEIGSPPVITTPGIRPEEIDTLELILMKSYKRSALSLKLFKSDWKDGIEVVTLGNGTLQYTNSGQHDSNGIEFDWQQTLNDQLSLKFNVSLIKSKNKKQDIDFSAFPEKMINLIFNYKIPQEDLEIKLANRFLSNFTDIPQGVSTFAVNDLSSYWRTDVVIQKTFSKGDYAQFKVQNILDKDLKLPSLLYSDRGYPEKGIAVTLSYTSSF